MWGTGDSASLITLATLFERDIHKIHLGDYPSTDKEQPDYLNISRFTTPLQLINLAQRKTEVVMLGKEKK